MCGATVTEPVTKARTAGARASWPLWLALALTALITVVRTTGTVDSDVAWQLWIAGRIHAGARLYRDIIEVNPPLWFWMALPVDSIASLFHTRIEVVLTLAIGGLAALSLCATDRLLLDLSPKQRVILLGYAALALTGIPWVHIGQREQIVLIGTLPYAALISARRDGKAVPPLLAALVGTGAALGFALKHYFLIVPGCLELWLLAGPGRPWRWRRPETVALIAIGILYFAAVLLWARQFLTDIVPLIRLSYGSLGAPSWRHLFGPYAIAGLMILCLAAFGRHAARQDRVPFASNLLVAAVAFAAIYFIQAKGWIYHSIPLLGCASLALAALLVESRSPMRLLRLTAPAILSLPLFLAAGEARNAALPGPYLEEAVAGLQPADSVGFLTVETAVPWSITLQRQFRYPSRYMGDWMFPAIARNEYLGNPDPRLAMLGQRIVAETVTDFTCAPPQRILVARPRPGEQSFDILPFFLRDPRFGELLSHYTVRSRTSLETYELASRLPLPAGQCRRGI